MVSAGPGDRGAAAPGESRREWTGEGEGEGGGEEEEPSPAANGRGGLAAVIAALGPPPRCSWKRVRSNSINQLIDRLRQSIAHTHNNNGQ